MNNIPFIDLATQQQILREQIDTAIASVLEHGKYILGPEVSELETKLEEFSGAANAITCANGTDALTLALMAENIGMGHAVFVPAFTFVATAEAVAQLGAVPFFVDVEPDSYNIDVNSLKRAIKEAADTGLKAKAIIAVDLFGLPADYDELNLIAKENQLILIADAAQSFGASSKGRQVGSLADYTTASFFPAKPLGCYGDGGAVFTNHQDKADLLRSLRFHGKGSYKYDNVRIGLNSRLDTLQAAILLVKLSVFKDELCKRNDVAQRYNDALSEICVTPVVREGLFSAWAQYTIRVENREEFAARLQESGVPTAVYYPIPLNKQQGYKHFPVVSSGVNVSEEVANQVISLPMHPYLEVAQQNQIIQIATSVLKGEV